VSFHGMFSMIISRHFSHVMSIFSIRTLQQANPQHLFCGRDPDAGVVPRQKTAPGLRPA
jgi:hypothetical protein